MYRRAVHAGEAAGHGDDPRYLVGPVGAHAHDQRSGERAGGDTLAVGGVHRHVLVLVLVSDPESRLEQRRLKGEAAAEQEGDHVPAPVIGDILRLLDQASALVDAVAGKVGSQVGPRRGDDRLGGTGLGHLHYRTRTRVAHAELQEVEGVLLRQRHEVRLCVGPRHPARRAIVATGSDRGSHPADRGGVYLRADI